MSTIPTPHKTAVEMVNNFDSALAQNDNPKAHAVLELFSKSSEEVQAAYRNIRDEQRNSVEYVSTICF